MIKLKNKKTFNLVFGGIIAAAYVVLTLVSSAFGLAYGPIQFRLSEVLTILPIFTPAAIPGLIVGCLISNLGSPNAVDLIFGTLATAIAAYLTYSLRNIKIKNFPFLAFLPPILVNGILVGFEISYFFLDGFTYLGFLISGLEVTLGQTAVCFLLGTPLYFWIEKHKNNIFK